MTYASPIMFCVGIVTRFVGPWLIKVYKSNDDDKVSWEWKYLRGQVIAITLVLLLLPMLYGEDIAAVYVMNGNAAFLAGYGVASIGNDFINKGIMPLD